MKQIINLFTLLSLASMVLLAGCRPTPPEIEESDLIIRVGDVSDHLLIPFYGFQPDDNGEITLYVGATLQEYTDETCMMVKENPEDEYICFNQRIGWFTYEEGYEYELQVLVTPIGGSSLDVENYSLVEIVSKTAVVDSE